MRLAVDASNETTVIASMLDQSARVTGAHAGQVLLDAGYFDDEVIAAWGTLMTTTAPSEIVLQHPLQEGDDGN